MELDYPARLCAHLILNTALEWKRTHRKANLKKIIFALHDREVYEDFNLLSVALSSGSLLSMPNFTGEDRAWQVTKVEIS